VIAQLLSPRASFVAAGIGALTVLVVAVPLLRRVDWRPEVEPQVPADAVADAPTAS
jgi:hypothetical protein